MSATVRESVAGAVGTDSFAVAAASFVRAFSTVGAAGALLAAVAGWIVWRLVPSSHRLSDSDH